MSHHEIGGRNCYVIQETKGTWLRIREGQGAPWDTGNNSKTRKSGSSWNSTSCYPLWGGGTEGGWQCLQTPVCAAEAAGIKMEIGMCWNWKWDGRMRSGVSGTWERFSTGALEIRKEWIWHWNNSLLNPDLNNTYDSFQTPQMTEKIDCCKAEVHKNKENKRGDTCNKSLKVGKWTTGIDSANPRKLNTVLVVGRAEM